MDHRKKKNKFALFEPFLVGGVIVLGIWYLVNLLNTGNPFWFLPIQPSYTPSRIVIYNYGQVVTIRPGDPAFNTLVSGLNDSLAAFQNQALVDIGISDETLQRYHDQELVLDIYFPDEIKFNLPIRFSQVNNLLIPIDGRHSDSRYVFLGKNGQYLAGALQVMSRQPLDDALRLLGYLDE